MQARFADRDFSAPERRYFRDVFIDTNHVMAGSGDTNAGGCAHLASEYHCNTHASHSITQGAGVTVFEDNIAYHSNMRKCYASPSIPCRSYSQCYAALLRICATFWLFFLELVCLGWMAVATPAIGQISEQTFGPDNKFERCRTITNDTARLRCYEEATPKPAISPSQMSGRGIGAWRLVRTPNPSGGRDVVSIMETADISKSDLDLAGLMLRCGESGVEVLLVLVRPLPPRADPKVTVSAGGRTADFTATIVPPGVAVLLPKEATTLATGVWKAAPELSVQISVVQGEDERSPIRGVISLAGLGEAFTLLLSNCPLP